MDNGAGIIREVTGTIRTLFGMTRHNRLSDHIGDSVRLYEQVEQHEELKEAARDLAKVVNLQAAQLLAVVTDRPRRWDWSTFSGGVILAALSGFIAWLMWKPWGLTSQWWGTVLVVFVLFFTAVCVAVSIQALLQRQPA